MAGAWSTRRRAGVSPALPKVWPWPLDTLTKSPGPAHGRPLEFDGDGALEDEESLRAVGVPVRGWPAPAGGKGAFHEREIAIGLFCYRFEGHHAASSREDNPFTGSEERRVFPGRSLVNPAHRPSIREGSVAHFFLETWHPRLA
jgi:hypothetical protein